MSNRTNYYTLEYHLEKICLENKEFEILDSIWKLNKRTLTSALASVSFNFPHYSLHETSHSRTIISNIESFLGEERIKKLEPTDTWLLLMSAYSHDLGMIVLHSTIEKQLTDEVLSNFLESLSKQNYDKDLRSAAMLLLSLKKEAFPADKSIFELRKSIVYILGEFFRRGHAQRSKEIIGGKDSHMRELLSNFYSDLIPNRFLHLLSEIAFSHGADFEFIIDSLEYESNGISRDKIHPRFIASMLRLGDLLDVDDKRFDPVSELLVDKGLPSYSELHKEKHASIRHLLITPAKIEAIVNCPNPEVYRIARQWFDWLENEVKLQNQDWAIISPSELNYLPPKINIGGVKVLYDNELEDIDLMNLKFSIDSQKAIEIFEGKGIYEDTSFVFLREIVQNAVDASKIQLWKDIKNGNYSELIIEKLKQRYNGVTEKNYLGFIKFPDDIPNTVYVNYQVDLFINSSSNTNEIIFEVIDRGCGISRTNLIRMTSKVGESRGKDIEFQELKKSMPYWLKPTGAFGLGLQSVFLVTNSFKVKTKADNDISYEIVFNSSKNGEYSYISNFEFVHSRGTSIRMVIDENNFLNAFGNKFSHREAIDTYFFPSEDETIIDKIQMDKIRNYIYKTLINIKELNIYLKDKAFKRSRYKILENSEDEFNYDQCEIRGDLKMSLYQKHGMMFNVFDLRGKFGSQISISFIESFKNIYTDPLQEFSNRPVYVIRDIPLEDLHHMDRFYWLSFCELQWNLFNPDSDKILNISRSRLIEESKKEHEDYLKNEVLPNVFELTWEVYINKRFLISDIKDARYNIILFHIFQTLKIFNIKKEIPSSFEHHFFPIESIFYKESKEKVSFKVFLECNEISILRISNTFNTQRNLDMYLNSEIGLIKTKSKTEIIAVYSEYFSQHLFGFNLEEITKLESKVINSESYLYKYSKSFKKTECVAMPRKMEQEHIMSLCIIDIQGSRFEHKTVIPSLKKYNKYLSVSKVNDSLYHYNFIREYYSYIISPFRNRQDITSVSKLYQRGITKNELWKKIYKKKIKEVVSDNLIDWIKTYSTGDQKRTSDQILKAYSKLLAESIILNHQRKEKGNI